MQVYFSPTMLDGLGRKRTKHHHGHCQPSYLTAACTAGISFLDVSGSSEALTKRNAQLK